MYVPIIAGTAAKDTDSDDCDDYYYSDSYDESEDDELLASAIAISMVCIVLRHTNATASLVWLCCDSLYHSVESSQSIRVGVVGVVDTQQILHANKSKLQREHEQQESKSTRE